MLPITDLKAFSDNHRDIRPNIQASIMVSSDDEVSKLITELSNANDTCTLITVVPSHDPNIPDEDTRQSQDRLLFFVVKKYDSKGGNMKKLENFSITQTEVKELLNKIIDYKDNPNGNCLFDDVDFSNSFTSILKLWYGSCKQR